jgi:rare lipoprotein A
MYAMTAAHKTLPFGTYVRVRNLSNNRETEVRVNDRGPFVRGRIIDLSYTSAKKIDLVGAGTAPVEIVALGVSSQPWDKTHPPVTYVPVDYTKGNFTIQVGAFENRENAERLKQQLDKKYRNVHITTFDAGSGLFYRVRVGQFTDLKKATESETTLIRNGFPDAFTVAE